MKPELRPPTQFSWLWPAATFAMAFVLLIMISINTTTTPTRVDSLEVVNGANLNMSGGTTTIGGAVTFSGGITSGFPTSSCSGNDVLTAISAAGAGTCTEPPNFDNTNDGYTPASGGGTANFLRADGSWAVPPGTGGVSDGDKGDITVSGGGATWTIDNNAVTDAKLRDSAALSVIGRSANSTGDPADIAAANDAEVLRRSGTTIGFGTIATAGITDAAVTYAKIQDVSATSRFLGRISSGSGDTEELTGTQATTLLDAFTSGAKGLAPASGGGTANFLRADGTWTTPSGSATPLKASLTTNPAIANTETVVTSYTAGSNTLTAGMMIRMSLGMQRAGTNGTAPTIRVRIGPTTLTGTIVLSEGGLATAAVGNLYCQGSIVVTATGASGSVSSNSFCALNTSGTATINHSAIVTAATIDTTVSNLVEITFISGNASNTYTGYTAELYQFAP